MGQNILSAASGKPIISNEPPRTGTTFAFFWGRVVMSLAILGFCLAVTMVALFNGDTQVKVKYPSIPNGVNVFLFFFFMAGAITGLNIKEGEDNNIFGIRDSAQKFLNFGFHGAVITTILASISWQLAASAFPIAFLNNPMTYVLLVIALFLEFIGICSGAWVIARLIKSVLGFQYDEVYVGTPEERMANNHGDRDVFARQEVGMGGGGWGGHLVGSHDALDGPIEAPAAAEASA